MLAYKNLYAFFAYIYSYALGYIGPIFSSVAMLGQQLLPLIKMPP